MHDPQELRDLARRCRTMVNISLKPCVNQQLGLWAAELADYTDEIERHAERAAGDTAGHRKSELAS